MSTKADPNTIVLPLTRLSFSKIFKAEGFGGSEENKKFSCNFLLDKEKHANVITKIEKRIAAMLKEEKVKVPSDKRCLKDGDDLDQDGYEGCMYISASNGKRPDTCKWDGGNVSVTEEDAEAEDILYSGCYVDGVIRLWVQNNKWGKRVNASLETVRHRKKGERFGGGRASADSVLDDVPMDEDEDDTDDMLG